MEYTKAFSVLSPKTFSLQSNDLQPIPSLQPIHLSLLILPVVVYIFLNQSGFFSSP